MWWPLPVIPAMWSLREEHCCKFSARLSHIQRHCVKKKKKKDTDRSRGNNLCSVEKPHLPECSPRLRTSSGEIPDSCTGLLEGSSAQLPRRPGGPKSHALRTRGVLCFPHLGFPSVCMWGGGFCAHAPAAASPGGLGESSTATAPTRSGVIRLNQRGAPGEGGGGGLPAGSSPGFLPRGRHGNRAGAAERATGKPGRCAHAPPRPGVSLLPGLDN